MDPLNFQNNDMAKLCDFRWALINFCAEEELRLWIAGCGVGAIVYPNEEEQDTYEC
jgi:hypothetical protein